MRAVLEISRPQGNLCQIDHVTCSVVFSLTRLETRSRPTPWMGSGLIENLEHLIRTFVSLIASSNLNLSYLNVYTSDR